MTLSMLLVGLLVLALAWANGANDVSKGVATLAGGGVANATRALLWGTFCTVLGGLAALGWGGVLVSTFSNGFLQTGFPFSLSFVAGVMVGAAAWVFLATRLGLPVSTTHALLGGVVGAALVVAGPAGLHSVAIANKALVPLLLSPLLAIVFCWGLLLLMRFVEKKIPAWSPGCCVKEEWRKNPFVCAGNARQLPLPWVQKVWVGLHWLSSGATSFARGLNDVPKIAAFLVLVIALAPGASTAATQHGTLWSIAAVTLVMGLGSLWGGLKVLQVLAHKVTAMDTRTGLVANVGTSLLVIAATPLGLPVSTTHVSTGALMGIRWAGSVKPAQGDALKLILFGWVITLPVAAACAALSAGLFGLF
ncbi:MAG TPA: inorganic phosphate transporter [Gammaproteobacteria bacterium]|nr:inorganic phosphate transporter [Gammaproteobacteria bacterium]